jgi:hypothetical protein
VPTAKQTKKGETKGHEVRHQGTLNNQEDRVRNKGPSTRNSQPIELNCDGRAKSRKFRDACKRALFIPVPMTAAVAIKTVFEGMKTMIKKFEFE